MITQKILEKDYRLAEEELRNRFIDIATRRVEEKRMQMAENYMFSQNKRRGEDSVREMINAGKSDEEIMRVKNMTAAQVRAARKKYSDRPGEYDESTVYANGEQMVFEHSMLDETKYYVQADFLKNGPAKKESENMMFEDPELAIDYAKFLEANGWVNVRVEKG